LRRDSALDICTVKPFVVVTFEIPPWCVSENSHALRFGHWTTVLRGFCSSLQQRRA